jgi:hypothetical protein
MSHPNDGPRRPSHKTAAKNSPRRRPPEPADRMRTVITVYLLVLLGVLAMIFGFAYLVQGRPEALEFFVAPSSVGIWAVLMAGPIVWYFHKK